MYSSTDSRNHQPSLTSSSTLVQCKYGLGSARPHVTPHGYCTTHARLKSLPSRPRYPNTLHTLYSPRMLSNRVMFRRGRAWAKQQRRKRTQRKPTSSRAGFGVYRITRLLNASGQKCSIRLCGVRDNITADHRFRVGIVFAKKTVRIRSWNAFARRRSAADNHVPRARSSRPETDTCRETVVKTTGRSSAATRALKTRVRIRRPSLGLGFNVSLRFRCKPNVRRSYWWLYRSVFWFSASSRIVEI